jgi:hypothetical protein
VIKLTASTSVVMIALHCSFSTYNIVMTINPDDLSSALISQILFADSQEEVCHCIDAGVQKLQKDTITDSDLASFEEKLLAEIRQFDPMYKDPQQWSNIRMAKIYLNRLREKLKEVAH